MHFFSIIYFFDSWLFASDELSLPQVEHNYSQLTRNHLVNFADYKSFPVITWYSNFKIGLQNFFPNLHFLAASWAKLFK